MTQNWYRYTLLTDAPPEDLEATILLAIMTTESLHGEGPTHLDARFTFDAGARTCALDASTRLGIDFNRLFIGFLRREYGPEAFRVEHLHLPAAPV